jgi:glutamate racemase
LCPGISRIVLQPVLGCTHYPLLSSAIRLAVGPEIALVDSAQETALEVRKTLESRRLLNEGAMAGDHSYFVTDGLDRFRSLGQKFLGHRFNTVTQIDSEPFAERSPERGREWVRSSIHSGNSVLATG